MNTTTGKAKDKVKLRQRKMPSGNISLYLDVIDKGVRTYEYLKLYLIENPQTLAEKKKNKENIQLAQTVQAQRTVELRNNEFGFKNLLIEQTNFLDYFKKMTDDRFDSLGNYGNWESAYQHLKKFCPANITFKDVDSDFLESFKKYLAKAKSGQNLLSQNTKHSYYAKVKACLKQAVKDRIISINPADSVPNFKAGDPERNYLTIEEVKLLIKAECKMPMTKSAFLFSCMTGVRWSDILQMTWKMVQVHNGITRINFQQEKTEGQEYLDINPQAASLMGERGKTDDRVFPGLKYSAWQNAEIQRWVMSAGINKDITFHCARHTFAVMMIELDTEIYTVSKLLGHRDLKTTQIYTKVLDKSKQKAINKIPDFSID
jgi:integrase